MPTSFRRILATSDLSDASDECVRRAARLSKSLGASLTVCHVIPDRVGSEPLFPQNAAGRASELPRLRDRALRELAARAQAAGAPEESLEVAVLDGEPVEAILAHARAQGADLLAIGASRKTGVERAITGTVAGRVLREARTSVLLARPGPFTGRLAVAIDFSEPSDRAFEAAVEIAGKAGLFLTAIHVVDAPDFPEMGAVPLDVKSRAFNEVETALKKMVEDSGTGGDWLVEEGNPAEGILAGLAKAKAELLVVGTTGRSGVVFGSIAAKVAGEAPVPVLVVK